MHMHVGLQMKIELSQNNLPLHRVMDSSTVKGDGTWITPPSQNNLPLHRVMDS